MKLGEKLMGRLMDWVGQIQLGQDRLKILQIQNFISFIITKKMKITGLSCLMVIWIMLCTLCISKVFYMPPTVSLEDEQIRLNSIQTINEPKIELSKIYRREIFQKMPQDNKTNISSAKVSFSICQQSAPQISFDFIGYVPLQLPSNWTMGYDQPSGEYVANPVLQLVYDYERLKSQYKNIIDMVYYAKHVFTISSFGVIRVYTLNQFPFSTLQLKTTVNAVDWDALIKQAGGNNQNENNDSLSASLRYKHIGRGYFEFMDGNQLLLFSNAEFLIAFDIRTLKTVLLSQQVVYDKISKDSQQQQKGEKEYMVLQNFESVTKIDENHFAVLDKKKGAIVYKVFRQTIAQNQVQLQYTIKKVDIVDKARFGNAYEDSQDMNLVDVEFNKEKNLLLLLDYDKGVFSFDLVNIDSSNKDIPMFVLNADIILIRQCNLMKFSEIHQSLYLVCNKIHRISFMRWPLIQQKVFPHPLINIRQIFINEAQNIFVLAGYSVFKIMYLDRPVSYYEDDMLDKIIFSNDIAITANEYHIVAYKYELEKPQIVCQTSNQSLLGTHNVVLRTTAECQESYLQQINRTSEQKSKFDPEDICVYTVYKNVYVWQQGQIPVKALTFVIITFVVFVFLMFFWYIVTLWRAKRAKNYLLSLAGEGSVLLVQGNAPKSQQFKEDKETKLQDNVYTDTQLNKNGQNQSLDAPI